MKLPSFPDIAKSLAIATLVLACGKEPKPECLDVLKSVATRVYRTCITERSRYSEDDRTEETPIDPLAKQSAEKTFFATTTTSVYGANRLEFGFAKGDKELAECARAVASEHPAIEEAHISPQAKDPTALKQLFSATIRTVVIATPKEACEKSEE